MSSTPSPKLTVFRDCWEASMTFEEALGCSGLSEKSPEIIAVLRNLWDSLERHFATACRVEALLTEAA
jgi:hypothetical protein